MISEENKTARYPSYALDLNYQIEWGRNGNMIFFSFTCKIDSFTFKYILFMGRNDVFNRCNREEKIHIKKITYNILWQQISWFGWLRKSNNNSEENGLEYIAMFRRGFLIFSLQASNKYSINICLTTLVVYTLLLGPTCQICNIGKLYLYNMSSKMYYFFHQDR